MPMSSRRCSAATASVACSDDSTKWPVSADCTAMRAVSASRHLADEDDVGVLAQDRLADRWRRSCRPASFVWIWLIDGKTYSTGSSIVMMLRCGWLISASDA